MAVGVSLVVAYDAPQSGTFEVDVQPRVVLARRDALLKESQTAARVLFGQPAGHQTVHDEAVVGVIDV